MAVLTAAQVTQLAYNAGFRGNDLTIAVAVAKAESNFDTNSTNTYGNTPPSRDRGLWQINSYWNSEWTDACCYDAVCSSNAAYQIWKERGWKDWSAYNNGSYRQYLGLATGTGTPSASGQNDLATFYAPTKIMQRYGVPELGNSAAYGVHHGVDYGNPRGTPIPALFPGTVERTTTGCALSTMAGGSGATNCGGGFGNHPQIRMPDGKLVIYGHMEQVNVKPGDTVSPGTILGTVGSSGFSNGYHTHVQINTADGVPIDPTALINAAIQTGASYAGSTGSGSGIGIGPDTYNQIAYGLHRAVNHSDSFSDLALAMHTLEMMRPMTWSNPVGSVLANGAALMFRGLITLVGLTMVIIALVAVGLSLSSVVQKAQSGFAGGGQEAPSSIPSVGGSAAAPATEIGGAGVAI